MKFVSQSLIVILVILAPLVSAAKGRQCVAVLSPTAISKKTELRLQQAAKIEVELGEGRSLHLEWVKPSSDKLPTFLLLPGLNRSLLLKEPSALEIANRGYGLVVMDFSTQPFSVAGLPPKVSAAFNAKTFEVKDFTEEVQRVMDVMTGQYKVQNLIPVSLSFSALATPALTGQPLIIETVPMTSWAATNPDMAKYKSTLVAAQIFNPFFGKSVTRSALDQTYRMTWSRQVPGMIEAFSLPKDQATNMIDGYTSMSRAAEDFVWPVDTVPASTRRVFILAGGESASLFKNQLETFRNLFLTGKKSMLILVMEAGHLVPMDQPQAYADALEIALKSEGKSPGVVIIKPSLGEIEEIAAKDTDTFLLSLISSY